MDLSKHDKRYLIFFVVSFISLFLPWIKLNPQENINGLKSLGWVPLLFIIYPIITNFIGKWKSVIGNLILAISSTLFMIMYFVMIKIVFNEITFDELGNGLGIYLMLIGCIGVTIVANIQYKEKKRIEREKKIYYFEDYRKLRSFKNSN